MFKFPIKLFVATTVILTACTAKPKGPIYATPFYQIGIQAMPTGQLYDYCKAPATPAPDVQFKQGTAIPMTPVALGADWYDTPTPEVSVGTPIPPPPTAIPTPNIKRVDLTVTGEGNKHPKNFHVVLVPSGYKPEEIATQMTILQKSLEVKFKGVNIDFGYVNEPVDIDFGFNGVIAVVANASDPKDILNQIKKNYPVDSIAFAVKTTQVFGTSFGGWNYLIFTANNPLGLFTVEHETAHQLGLGDGYLDYYRPGKLPNSELFFADEMPESLALALQTSGLKPPVHLMGTCGGRNVYQFYESVNNVMSDYDFGQKTPHSWGPSAFTPIQILIMNENIQALRGK